jgi:hypothetical protein
MPDLPRHPATASDSELLAACEVRRLRRSGPGGQNRNKVETAVQLVHRPTGLVAEANERRSQAENQRVALRRLRLALAVGVRTDCPVGAPPSALWQSRCQRGRLTINPRHADFAPLLAETLDCLAAFDWDCGPAAERLRCTASQLVKLLGFEPRALAALNSARTERGLRPLHPRG